MAESTEIRCTVFRDEMPDLYDFLVGLPKSKQRKRDAIVRLLLTGLNPPMVAPVFPIQKATIVPPSSLPNVSTDVSQVVESGGVESIDANDLIAVFGTKLDTN